jgi:non-specific serine/threonine protein kinase/serine/threonine-protein kinase
MEYVTGIPITAYCDKYKMTPRERLELFVRVCDGVQHAHQKVILHRDLMPSKILVTEAHESRYRGSSTSASPKPRCSG